MGNFAENLNLGNRFCPPSIYDQLMLKTLTTRGGGVSPILEVTHM